jgi:hypothetical protein
MDQSAEKIMVEVASKGLATLVSETTKKVVEFVGKSKRKPEPRGDRRTHERRKGPIDMRLRTGISFEFYRKTRIGETQFIEYWNSQLRDKLIEAAVVEAERYELRDRTSGYRVSSAMAVNSVIELACQDWKLLDERKRDAGALTEFVARRLMQNFDIQQHDRRNAMRGALAAG